MGLTKETIEVLIIPAKVIDSTFASKADGEFDLREDFANYLDDIIALQPALQDARLLDDEAVTQDTEDRKTLKGAIVAAMPNVPQPKRDLYADAIMGAHAGLSLIWLSGFEAGQKRAAEGKPMLKL